MAEACGVTVFEWPVREQCRRGAWAPTQRSMPNIAISASLFGLSFISRRSKAYRGASSRFCISRAMAEVYRQRYDEAC